MIYRTYIPRPPLSKFVELLWYFEGDESPHEKERVLPTGTMEMVINLRDDALRVYDGKKPDRFLSLSSSLVCGAHSGFFLIDTVVQAHIMGVAFKPGALSRFWRCRLASCKIRTIRWTLCGEGEPKIRAVGCSKQRRWRQCSAFWSRTFWRGWPALWCHTRPSLSRSKNSRGCRTRERFRRSPRGSA